MKGTTLVVVGLGVLLLFNLANLGVAGNVLQYYIQAVNFTGITSGNIVIVVQNPSNANIQLNSMAGTVSANGTVIGNISNFQGGVAIPANQQVAVTVQVVLSLAGLASNVYAAVTNPTGLNQIAFVISGNANINNGIILPFTITQTIPV